MSLKVEKSIYDQLAATSAVTALVSTNIFFGNAAEGTAFPYITLIRISTDAVPVSSGANTNKTTNATIQVDIFARTYSSAKNVAGEVRTSLYGFSDTGGDPQLAPTLLVGEFDDMDEPKTGRGRPIYRVSQDYSVWFAD